MHPLFWALLVLGTLAVVLRMDWIYYLVYVIGGIWAISHWWVRRALRYLTVERKMLKRAFVGENIDVTMLFRNHSRLPIPWLHVREQAPLDLKDRVNYSLVLNVGSRRENAYSYTFACKKRGFYNVGPLVLRTGDLFGFVQATWQESKPTNVIVYPRVLPLGKLGLPSRSPFGTLNSRQQLFEDPVRVAGVRDYASGDSMRRIHWKASAHESSLLVKKVQPAIALNATIVLDLARAPYGDTGAFGNSEWAVIVAASLAAYATEQRQPVGLVTNGRDPLTEEVATAVPAHHGQGQLMSVLALLARIQMHETEQLLASWLPRQIATLDWGTTLLVITPHLDTDTLWLLHNAYRRGSSVLVLVCAPQANLSALQAQGGSLGISIHRSVWEEDLAELRE